MGKDMSHWLQNHEVQNTNKVNVNIYIYKYIFVVNYKIGKYE